MDIGKGLRGLDTLEKMQVYAENSGLIQVSNVLLFPTSIPWHFPFLHTTPVVFHDQHGHKVAHNPETLENLDAQE